MLFDIAIKNLWRRKLRSILTILGVAVAVQLYNYVSQRPTWQRCDNAPWHGRAQTPWFTVQRTDRRKRAGGHGPQDAGKRVRFCSRSCAKAFTERERRRRLKEGSI